MQELIVGEGTNRIVENFVSDRLASYFDGDFNIYVYIDDHYNDLALHSEYMAYYAEQEEQPDPTLVAHYYARGVGKAALFLPYRDFFEDAGLTVEHGEIDVYWQAV